ncbi:MAG: 16S rRNA (uracil(1498)-N(3))-methyltransferase, partial [Halanaerobium sp. MSAO_Bac5]
VSDKDGFDLQAKIVAFNDDSAELEVIEREKSAVEAELKVIIAQGLPKKRKMDLIVEKATEIGFKALIPLETERTIVKYNHKKKQKKLKRWQRVAEAAAKQSGRSLIPEIRDFCSLSALKELKDEFDYSLILWEDEAEFSLKKFFKQNQPADDAIILLIIGPEGGFSAEEVEKAKKDLQAEVISLGPRIMRTETAGISALSCLLYEKGELGG